MAIEGNGAVGGKKKSVGNGISEEAKAVRVRVTGIRRPLRPERLEWRVKDGIAKAGGLPSTVSIREELEWVAAHAHERLPDFSTAPSVAACNMWAMVKLNEGFARDFWNMHLKRRQPALRGVEKDSPFKEDHEDRVSSAGDERLEELGRRLFGLGGSNGG